MLLSARKYKKDSQSMIGTAPHIARNPDPVDTDAGIVLWRVVMIIHLTLQSYICQACIYNACVPCHMMHVSVLYFTVYRECARFRGTVDIVYHDRGRLTDGSSPGGYFVKRKQIEETKSFVKTPEGERYPEGSPRI